MFKMFLSEYEPVTMITYGSNYYEAVAIFFKAFSASMEMASDTSILPKSQSCNTLHLLAIYQHEAYGIF